MERHLCRYAIVLAVLVGAANIAGAQATPDAADPHHAGGSPQAPGASPEVAGPPMDMSPGSATTPRAESEPGTAPEMAGMMDMMTPEMMQMMMRMMAGQCAMMGNDMAVTGPDAPRPMRQVREDMSDKEESRRMRRMPEAHRHGREPREHEASVTMFEAPRLLAPEDVRARLAELLEDYDNPRLRLGTIALAGEDTITAVVETIDGSLVERFVFDRFTGNFAQTIE